MITLLPAIDMKAGKVVRLLQGRDDATTEYGSDPVEVAKRFAGDGAKAIHVVNLDGAFGRASDNLAIVSRIVIEVGVPIEFGGGLRSPDDVAAAFQIGVGKAVIGTMAFEQRVLFSELLGIYGPEKIVAALDARHGVVATRGWTESTGVSVVEAGLSLYDVGVREVLYTDVGRDGMQTGTDLPTMKLLLEKTRLNVIASGGIGGLRDLLMLKSLNHDRLTGVVVGKALYERAFTIRQAIDVLQ
jgi:phosphoribosylformimino-5-aminoimidazole carboxamide ribotide isomerase